MPIAYSCHNQHTKNGKFKKSKSKTESDECAGDLSDPELLAELQYALDHNTEVPVKLLKYIHDGGDAVAEVEIIKKKAKQEAKAFRKARGRGVSGSMSKKGKDFDEYLDIDELEYCDYKSDASEADGIILNAT